MDGVLVDSERIWTVEEHAFMTSVFGEKITQEIGDTMGVSVNHVYEKALRSGAQVEKEDYVKKFDDVAASIYARAAITNGTDALVNYLISQDYKIGLVTASRYNAVEQVLRQLPFRDSFEVVISINDEGLPSKPAPDGYLEALRRIDSDPKRSTVLEDSNRGIASGKAAGCFVIGFREYLVPGHEQTGADAYADTMDDVIKLVEQSAPHPNT